MAEGANSPVCKSEMGTCNIHLGITKEESDFGGRWVILLSFPESQSWTAYYSDGSPFKENPYDWTYVNGQHKYQTIEFERTPLLGNLEEERFRTFHEAFFDTEPGPDQFFAVRFLHSLGKRGLLEQGQVRQVLALPEYSNGEAEYFYGNLCQVDHDFYQRELAESGHRPRDPEAAAELLPDTGAHCEVSREDPMYAFLGVKMSLLDGSKDVESSEAATAATENY
ncbi:uncharacterized protein BDV17DRAFT_294618 [Aspergillus undulatus]|uniref:uncharacterized protein n=1 Tax=Aspergillus undulatus TaxID=1810928 RepID=UPI003CCDC8B9